MDEDSLRIYEFWNLLGEEEACKKFNLTLDELYILIGKD